MFESVLRIKYVTAKTCFVYLSSKHKNLNTGIYIKLTYGDNKATYFSASVVQNSVDIESIGMNPLYARVLGLNEDDFVNISQIEQLPVINSISIQPFNKSDYEVLEILSQNVQSNLLDQVRVVNRGQSLIIWIGNSLSVNVLVDNVQPISPGVLDFLTEVVINPPDNGEIYRNQEKEKDKFDKNPHYIKDFVQFLKQNSIHGENIKYDNYDISEDLYYRLVPLSELPNIENKLKNVSPFAVFVSKNSQFKCVVSDSLDQSFYCMTLLNCPYVIKKLYIKLCFLEDIFSDFNHIFIKNNSCNIFVNDLIFNFMQCEFGARVVLKKVLQIPLVKEIEVHSKKNYILNVIEKLKIYLSDNCTAPLVMNAGFPIKIDKKLYCSLKFLPGSNEFCVIDNEFLRNCSYTLCDEEVRPLEQTFKKFEFNESFCMDILPAQDACHSILSFFCRNNEYRAENVILTGKPGMGKSAFLDHVTRILRNYPYFINTQLVSCKKIKGKTVDSLHKYLTDIFAKLIFCQPSLLVLDDLHVLCEHCEGEETPNTVYFNRVSEMLYGLFSVLSKYNSIGILASTESVSKLNKNVYRSRGNHLFKNIFTIEELNKADRIILLKHFFKKHLVDPNLDYIELSIKTDGFVIQDIQDLYNKILYEAYKEPRREDQPTIRQDHCDITLKKSCALSLQNVKFHSAGSKSFEDIGGLHDVKNVLIESFLWPVKYLTIFANAPLRLQSGLLLYGPPGTGKTLLAGAAAKQCSLRLISIKGPELLSKYIGASEQAVRDVFEKAQRAKPCILFFDEFDSLAPRRGHDNTGVTDRVVNQLLTQLDGVEALTGVCVVAATSRPDLLDPALLRPGRLDKQLICPMPKKTDRLEILTILSRGLNLADDVDLNDVAERTEGYSGADLQSVLYTSQMASIKNFENHEPTDVTTKITQSCLLAALEQTRPSLTKSERVKYEKIYARFKGADVEDFRAGSKVTLA